MKNSFSLVGVIFDTNNFNKPNILMPKD